MRTNLVEFERALINCSLDKMSEQPRQIQIKWNDIYDKIRKISTKKRFRQNFVKEFEYEYTLFQEDVYTVDEFLEKANRLLDRMTTEVAEGKLSKDLRAAVKLKEDINSKEVNRELIYNEERMRDLLAELDELMHVLAIEKRRRGVSLVKTDVKHLENIRKWDNVDRAIDWLYRATSAISKGSYTKEGITPLLGSPEEIFKMYSKTIATIMQDVEKDILKYEGLLAAARSNKDRHRSENESNWDQRTLANYKKNCELLKLLKKVVIAFLSKEGGKNDVAYVETRLKILQQKKFTHDAVQSVIDLIINQGVDQTAVRDNTFSGSMD